MQQNNNNISSPAAIDSLEALSMRKQQLEDQLLESETLMSDAWCDIFRHPSEEELSSPSKRIAATVNSASAIIDGALLGWKLYKRLGGTIKFFRRKKK